ncbi:MAG: DUF2723 domain-containing protein [Ignavibacteriae bacterium]|nr:DUF2723 domain-containing protein [Ignavibacteriota bacterium]
MNDTTRFVLNPRLHAAASALVAFLVYLKTLAPTVSFIDSGELAAVACTLGVAHPTGYPLFTLLGWVFSKLPTASEEIVRLNVMAAFFSSVGIFFFHQLTHLLLTTTVSRTALAKEKHKARLTHGLLAASAGASMMLAFSETYWSQATSIEVYSLHALFLSVVSYSFFKAVLVKGVSNGGDDSPRESSPWWYVFAFALGLSFTNHMTTILLAPGFLYLYFATQGSSPATWKRIGLMGLPFLLGLSVYLYLLFRAVQSPILNWGYTVNFERFTWHLTAKQYRVWITWFTDSAGRQFSYFLQSLPLEFAYVGVALAILGILILWRTNRKIANTIVLMFVGCILYSINYDIHDIDSYFLLAYVAVALAAGCGVFSLYSWLLSKQGLKSSTAAWLLVGIGLVPLFVHYAKNDESKNYLVEDYTMNMFGSLQPNAMVFSFQWDYWVSASYYYQIVKNVRPDVVVIDKELLRRSWYLKELGNRFPWLIRGSQEQVDAFGKELYKFEHDLPYNSSVIQARFVEMILDFISKNIASRPVYVTPEMEPEFTEGFQRVPEGLALRLYTDSLYHEPRVPPFSYRPFDREGRLENSLRNMYVRGFIAAGSHLYRRGKIEEAEAVVSRAFTVVPNSPEALAWLRQIKRGL